MSSAPGAREIAKDATWLAQALDPAAAVVRVVRMDPEAYRSASFLDDRMFQQPRDSQFVPWQVIEAASGPDSRRDARWIFHIGHVGSTLVARLVGELDGVLSIREPRLLRDIAALADPVEPAEVAQALFSRTFADGEVALVKATSFVSEIADALVPEGQRALFMYAGPRHYIASILAGPASLQELAALAPSRARRSAPRVSLPKPRTAAESAAAAWACEMTALESAAERMPGREIAWVDFDEFLNDVPAGLARIASHLDIAAPDDRIGEIATGPMMSRYSKATEYPYSPSLRRDLMTEANAANARDIDSALAMLQSAADQSPLLARALSRPVTEA